MKKLYVLKGLPASGKSTWAKNKVKEEYNTVIVNRDSIRTMLKGMYNLFPFNSKMEDLVTEIEQSAMQTGLALNYNVIMDATNFRWNLSKEYIQDFYKAELEIIDFTNVSIRTCIERDSKRESPVGYDVIMKMANKYLKSKLQKEIDPANKDICVCDIRDIGISEDLFGKYCLQCGYNIK